MKTEIYKEFYQFEWDHRSHLTSALNIPIVGATVIGGGIAFLAQSFIYSQSYINNTFVLLLLISSLFLLSVIFFIFKAFHGYVYSRISTPLKFKAYYDELLKWHVQYGNGKDSADKKFEEYFNLRVAEAAEVNAHNNKNRSAYLYRTNVSLALSLLFLIISSAPYLYVKINESKEDKVYSIKVVQPLMQKKENKMCEADEDEQVTDDDVPPEPTAPDNENIKEYGVEKDSSVIIKRHQK